MKELGMISLKKRILGKDLINAYKYLMSRCQEEGARVFSVVPSDRARGNGCKLKHRKVHLSVTKSLFISRVRQH